MVTVPNRYAEWHSLPGSVGEDEDRTATGIVTETVDHFGVETVEGLPHVAGFEREEDPQAAGKCQHGRRRVESSSAASGSAAREATSMTVPQGSTIRRAAEEDGGACSRITTAKGETPGGSDALPSRRLRSQAMKV